MINSSPSAALAPNTVCFSVDVEWAAQPVLDDVRNLFDQHGVAATFFVTHAGVSVPGHERGLHPLRFVDIVQRNGYSRTGDPVQRLNGSQYPAAYEKQRLEATTRIVLTNRSNPPDAILREVFQRSHDKPFRAIEDIISLDELRALSDGYKQIAGYSVDSLRKRGEKAAQSPVNYARGG